MTQKVAEYLNYLRRQAKQEAKVPEPSQTRYQIDPRIIDECLAVAQRCRPQAMDDEIAAAAGEYRDAEIHWAVDQCQAMGYVQPANGLQMRAYRLGWEEMKDIAARYNAKTAAEYEAYRRAAEQRIAVEPDAC